MNVYQFTICHLIKAQKGRFPSVKCNVSSAAHDVCSAISCYLVSSKNSRHLSQKMCKWVFSGNTAATAVTKMFLSNSKSLRNLNSPSLKYSLSADLDAILQNPSCLFRYDRKNTQNGKLVFYVQSGYFNTTEFVSALANSISNIKRLAFLATLWYYEKWNKKHGILDFCVL